MSRDWVMRPRKPGKNSLVAPTFHDQIDPVVSYSETRTAALNCRSLKTGTSLTSGSRTSANASLTANSPDMAEKLNERKALAASSSPTVWSMDSLRASTPKATETSPAGRLKGSPRMLKPTLSSLVVDRCIGVPVT
ncbi:hypothetical protein D3C87_1346670 [compost metagenome]